MSEFPRVLREMLGSQVIDETYPGLTWCTDAITGMLKVSIPVTPQHSRTHVIGAPDELASFSVTQLRDLIGFYFPEPSDPHSLLAIIADDVHRLRIFDWETARVLLTPDTRKRVENEWQELGQTIQLLQRVLADILPKEEEQAHGGKRI